MFGLNDLRLTIFDSRATDSIQPQVSRKESLRPFILTPKPPMCKTQSFFFSGITKIESEKLISLKCNFFPCKLHHCFYPQEVTSQEAEFILSPRPLYGSHCPSKKHRGEVHQTHSGYPLSWRLPGSWNTEKDNQAFS